MRALSLNFIIFLLVIFSTSAQIMEENNRTKVYLIPGQGADYRLFSKLKLSDKFDTVYIHFVVPPKKCDLKDYAKLLLQQIDTSENFVLVGVSIGGMLAVEMSELTRPREVIVISSAKCRKELPHRYRFMRILPLNKLTPPFLYKIGAQIAQPIVEPDRRAGKEVFKAMLKAKDGKFLKRTANMIINWKRKGYPSEIVHIHGDNDHTIPIRKVKADYKIKNGSHMMVYTKALEINTLVEQILCK